MADETRYPARMISIAMTSLGTLALAVWLYLLIAHHGFWRAGPMLARGEKDLPAWPSVVAVIPARDEALVIERSVRSLLRQDYPGQLDVVVVDDGSRDGTGDIVTALIPEAGAKRSLQLYHAQERPAGWSGKLWAVQSGMTQIEADGLAPPFLLLTDADIAHDSGSLSALLKKNG